MIDYKAELNEAQYQAVTTTEGPLLFLAGAGVGKTRTLVYRVSYLIEQGVNPEQILLLTFTNKAADEMKERIIKLVGEDGLKITACTYHSFCAMWLRTYGDKVGLTNQFTILDTGDVEDIITMARTELALPNNRALPKSPMIAGIASSMINENLTLREVLQKPRYERYEHMETDIERVLDKAEEIKEADHLASYDDLMVRFLQLLTENETVRNKLAKLYRYIMIDEYQDTNNIQDEIVLALRRENKNLVVVGDDHQSLYAFRGANVENIIHFPDRFDDCQTIKLLRNYRSNQEILDVANAIIKNHSTEGFQKELTGWGYSGRKPHLCRVDSVTDQTNTIMELIEEQHRNGIPFSEMAILHRWGFEASALEVELNARQIPYVKYGGKRFLERAHVKDILAYIKIMVNPYDKISWFRILKVHEGIGNTYSREIATMCKTQGIEGLVATKYFKRKFYKELIALKEALKNALSLDWKDSLVAMKDFYIRTKKTDIDTMRTSTFHKEELRENLEENILPDILVLEDLSKEYNDPARFLDDLNLDAARNDETDDAIVLSTIHSAKGLEFDTVFLLDCVDEVFPFTTENEHGSKEDNEELRCFYVAVTRAKNTLWLFCPQTVRKFSRLLYGEVNHYIKDIKELFTYLDLTE